jgi:hypothetical protein
MRNIGEHKGDKVISRQKQLGYPRYGVPDKWMRCRRGADSPKDESGTGMTGSVSSSKNRRSVNFGNGTCIQVAAKTSSIANSQGARRL